jgi:hypothetical protein
MKLGALRDSFDFFNNSGRNLLTAALIALAAYECAELIIEDDPLRLYSAGLVVLSTVALLAIPKDWRRKVYCFVAWIAVEDLMIVYFAKVPVRQASWRRCFSAFHDENGIHPGPTRVAVERLIAPAFSSIHGAGSRWSPFVLPRISNGLRFDALIRTLSERVFRLSQVKHA